MYSRKNPPPSPLQGMARWKNLTKGGVKSSGNLGGRGKWSRKYGWRGVIKSFYPLGGGGGEFFSGIAHLSFIIAS